MGPDPTRLELTFDPQRGWPAFDPTQRDFFDPKEKKLKYLTYLREIFQTQTINGWPYLIQNEQLKIDPTQPRSKNLYLDPSLGTITARTCHRSYILTVSTSVLISLLIFTCIAPVWGGVVTNCRKKNPNLRQKNRTTKKPNL